MSASDPTAGHIELEWSLDAIRMGYRHRQEQGDIPGLAESIRRQGFLHPLTITPDGLLICGGRRYLAAQYLGLKTVNVWVRTGISDKLSLLLAAQPRQRTGRRVTHAAGLGVVLGQALQLGEGLLGLRAPVGRADGSALADRVQAGLGALAHGRRLGVVGDRHRAR